MKHLLVITILFASLCSCAQNYFTEGTVWEVRAHLPYPYDPSPIYEVYSLENKTTVAGYECLELHCMTNGDPSTKHVVYRLRTEGKKVYALDEDKSGK